MIVVIVIVIIKCNQALEFKRSSVPYYKLFTAMQMTHKCICHSVLTHQMKTTVSLYLKQFNNLPHESNPAAAIAPFGKALYPHLPSLSEETLSRRSRV